MTPTELRAMATDLEGIRRFLMNVSGANPGTELDAAADKWEWKVLAIEDVLHREADRQDPPHEVTGQQWLRGLTVQAVRP